MSQNRSHAVMAQRVEAHDSLDDFPTPPWGTRALTMMMQRRQVSSYRGICWEPAANRGHMVDPLAEHFQTVRGSDVNDYGAGFEVDDFLFPMTAPRNADWIITNPPFRLGMQFALQARKLASEGVAMLVRTQFLESGERYAELYSKDRPNFVFQFTERLPMVKGRYDPKASTATSYCWLVWLQRVAAPDTIFDWIPPCRKQLERASDYPEVA